MSGSELNIEDIDYVPEVHPATKETVALDAMGCALSWGLSAEQSRDLAEALLGAKGMAEVRAWRSER